MDQEVLLGFADQMWYRESEARQRIKFRSEQQRVQYLQQSKESRDTLVKNLKDLDEKRKEAPEGSILGTTYNEIYNYALLAFGFALQNVKDAWIRFKYVRDIQNHANEMMELAIKAGGDSAKLQTIAQDAVWYRNILKDAVERALTPHAQFISRWMKRNYMTMEDVIKKYMKELNLVGKFEDLADHARTKVWNEIIWKSGQAKFEFTRELAGLGALGVGVLSLTLFVIVADIFTAKNKGEATFKAGLNLAAGYFIPIDAWSVKILETLYKSELPPEYLGLPADYVFGTDVVSGDITAGEAIAVAKGAYSNNLVIQFIDESVDGSEAGSQAGEFVGANFNVAEESTTLVIAEESVELGALTLIGGPFTAAVGLIVVEGVAGYTAGLVLGKLIDETWKVLDDYAFPWVKNTFLSLAHYLEDFQPVP